VTDALGSTWRSSTYRDGVCWPVADALTARKHSLPDRLGSHRPNGAYAPQLAKPFTLDGVHDAPR
jgi:hypothetical protein